MTDEQIAAIYLKATGIDISRVARGLGQAHAFLKELFDALPIAGYLDPDGTMHAEEWEASADCEPVYRRPE